LIFEQAGGKTDHELRIGETGMMIHGVHERLSSTAYVPY
jgi:hypothetical protein